ncbi:MULTISPECIES: hypothetical protein [Clostridium]|uniref:Mutator mutT-like protein n=1 Tax=Clostridium disporicum TaxID=84024 RepID=A0A174JQX2_9CLOT|nr:MULTISPECIES: hypothetical protein [Clostridium]MCD2501718.1 hypothetical protein [Clostridium sp. NSJ-145]MDU6340490.1 hypothetical protein [Clostridium sp.]CUP01031.1 mutator mutT-like protein [Clostridium disporicum]
MEKVLRCSILIVDDFNNVLVAERGKGKGATKTWGLFGKEIKGKEDEEKCITKAVDKDIKCNIFDLKPFKEYFDEKDNGLKVFIGSIKEYITCHKSINQVKWIGKNDIDKYEFNQEDIKILKDFFNI